VQVIFHVDSVLPSAGDTFMADSFPVFDQWAVALQFDQADRSKMRPPGRPIRA